MFTLHIPNLTLPNKNLFAVSLPNPNGIPSFSPGLRGPCRTGHHPPSLRSGAASPSKIISYPQRGCIASPSARGLAHSKTLRANRESQKIAPASWTAAALRRFSRSAAMVADLAAAFPHTGRFPFLRHACQFHLLRLVVLAHGHQHPVPLRS